MDDWGEYFRRAARRLKDHLARSLLNIIFLGVQSGSERLPRGVQAAIDWDVVNDRVLEYLDRYQLSRIDGLVETSRKRAVRIIDDWIRSGEPLPTLEARLTASGIFEAARAKSIAITEVTRIYAEGNKIAWRDTGMVGGQRWNTANDERVCIYCGPLNGKVVNLESGFMTVGNIVVPNPPMHPNCRCWLSPVVDMDRVRSEIARAING